VINLIMIMMIAVAVVSVLIGGAVGYFLRKAVAEAQVASAEQQAHSIRESAMKDAEAIRREASLSAKEEIMRSRKEMEDELRVQRNELQRQERRLAQREELLDRRAEALEKKEETIARRERDLQQREAAVEELDKKRRGELERIAGLTAQQARDMLLKSIQEEVSQEASELVRDTIARAREDAEKEARDIIVQAIQRTAADHTAEVTVSVVNLPNEEMKGRIIGREGRNIRTIETLTGVDLIIDDTPEAVVISAFDPIRREVARIALERLVADGRIHPARIEEMVEKAQKEVEQRIKEAGEQAAMEAGVHGLHPELIKLLGRLKYRTSYGQNILKHSVEVALLAGLMAEEVGADPQLARRAGLLHDIGKAMTHEVEGTHVAIGMEICRKYREPKAVIDSFAAHHGEFEPVTVEAFLVTAADAISASRPGARRESLETYLQRLQRLEEIAESFEGVEKSYAIQAGREVRIMVKPEKIDDLGVVRLSRDIVKKIEQELQYPGQIKVTVIRETRAVEYAR